MKMNILPGQGKQASIIPSNCTGADQSNFANRLAFHSTIAAEGQPEY